jgi:hypothetical protein
MKKRKKIDKIDNSYEISILIFMNNITLSNILIVIILSHKKFVIHYVIIFEIFLFFILSNNQIYKTLSNIFKIFI